MFERFAYSFGHATRVDAEIALIDMLESDEISEAERPIVYPYLTRSGKTRYAIEVDGIPYGASHLD